MVIKDKFFCRDWCLFETLDRENLNEKLMHKTYTSQLAEKHHKYISPGR
jgi:hypothetical protein